MSIRILFLRSYVKITFSAFIAGGLCCSGKFLFMQYPPIPDRRMRDLYKLHNPSIWKDYLAQNIISSKRELTDKIKKDFFDLVILSDYNFSFCSSTENNKLKKNIFIDYYNNIHQTVKNKINYLFGVSCDNLNIFDKIPVAVVDFDDWICIPPSGQYYLQNCTLYYKRELPFNRFFLYYPDRPSPWRKMREQILPLCGKTRRLPLGIEDHKYKDLQKLRQKRQDIDVFFCGQPTSTLRIQAAKELKKLARTTNWKIVMADSMSFKEFCEHIARSKITVSVSGGGWDCFRHYEATALGSLPLMDRPTVDTCWFDIADGSFFFDSTFGNFKERLEFFLTCPERRSAALAAITQHVEQEMLHSKIVERIVTELLHEKNNHYRNHAPETAADHPG
jgi:hypothetical protein